MSNPNYIPAPMPSERETHVDPRVSAAEQTTIYRRTLLLAGAGALLGCAGVANQGRQVLSIAQAEHWPEAATQVEAWISKDVHDPEFRRSTMFPRADVSSDGFGGRSAYELVDLNMGLTDAVNSRLTVFGGYRFGRDDISAAAMKHAASLFYRTYDVRSVKLNGRSMGSKVVFHAARAARSVESIFLDSGPFDLDDARDAVAARIAVSVAEVVHYEGDIPTQTVVNMFNLVKETGPIDFLVLLKRAFNLTLASENPEIIQQELNFIASDRPSLYIEDLKRVLTDAVIAGYSFSQDPETDRVVNTVTGYEKYRDFFATHFGIELKALAYKQPGHARMQESALSAAEYLEATYREIDPYDSVQRRHHGLIAKGMETELPRISEKNRERLRNALASGVLPSRQRYLF